jgi:Conjugative transposon protein TcpC
MNDAHRDASVATVVTTTTSLRRLRGSLRLTRWVLYTVAAVGVATTIRYAIAPPRPPAPRIPSVQRIDLAAEAFATLFARRYLTWDANRPDSYAQALAPFLGDAVDPNAGLRPPAAGTQSVQWAEVLQARDVTPAEHVYTVAAQTSPAGVVYLSVDVARDPVRGLALARYPAFVGPPATHPATSLSSDSGAAVGDTSLSRVVGRALRNYLAGSASNLAADLVAGARVTLPPNPLALQELTQLQWRRDGSGVLATVVADDQRGVAYTLSYELDVASASGRWEVAAIQTDPTS